MMLWDAAPPTPLPHVSHGTAPFMHPMISRQLEGKGQLWAVWAEPVRQHKIHPHGLPRSRHGTGLRGGKIIASSWRCQGFGVAMFPGEGRHHWMGGSGPRSSTVSLNSATYLSFLEGLLGQRALLRPCEGAVGWELGREQERGGTPSEGETGLPVVIVYPAAACAPH